MRNAENYTKAEGGEECVRNGRVCVCDSVFHVLQYAQGCCHGFAVYVSHAE
jgi:hypothetical protein